MFDPIHYRLTRPIRLTIMVFLIALFFIISPAVILYTMGFRYDFETGHIRQTGAISIDIEPEDARVYINDVLLDQGMPIRLTNRAPGVYRVRIEQNGFESWQKDMVIESNQTTYIRDIRLLQINEPVHVSSQPLYSAHGSPASHNLFVISPRTNAFALHAIHAQTGAQQEIEIYQTRPIIETNPFHATALLRMDTNIPSHITLIDMNDPERISKRAIPSAESVAYQWSKREGEVYLHLDGNLERFNVNGERKSIGVASSSLWYVEFPETIWSVTGSILHLQNDSDIAYSIPRNTERIIDINTERIILRTDTDIVVVHRKRSPEESVTHIPAHSWRYDPQSDHWWIWSDFEIHTISASGDISLLERSSVTIQDAQTLDVYGLTLIVDTDGLNAFNPGVFPSTKLVDTENITWVQAHPTLRTLLYTKEKEGDLHLFSLSY